MSSGMRLLGGWGGQILVCDTGQGVNSTRDTSITIQLKRFGLNETLLVVLSAAHLICIVRITIVGNT